MIYPKVSIVTVTYNAASDLDRTLKNLSTINYPSLEVVVIDGASSDNTRQVVENYPNLITRFVSEPDGGIYDAMNKGIEASTGEYLWFVNAGDLVHDVLLLERLAASDADVYYGDTLIRNVSGVVIGLRRKPLPKHLNAKSFRRGMVVCHQSIIVRRSIAPMYDLSYKYAADIEWVLTSLKRAGTIVNGNCVFSEFYEGGTSTSRRRESLKERFAIMRRHYGLFQTIVSHLVFVFELGRAKYRKL